MLRKKQPLIVYLTDSVLRVYQGDEQVKTVVLPQANEAHFKTLSSLFHDEIKSLLDKKDVLVVLGGKLLFQKAFVLEEQTVGEEDKEAFYKDLPIAEEDLARNTITTEHKVYLLGTDKRYYEALLRTTENIVAVLPLSLFSDDTSVEELTREQREDILKHSSLYEAGDFLSDNPFTPNAAADDSTPESITPHEQIVVKESSFNPAGLFKLLGISLLFAVLFFAGFVYLDQNGTQSPSNESVTEPKPTPTVVAENTILKEELTVQVLNGTGTPGQAGEVESILTDAGFINIEVGNAEEQDNQVTTVVVSSQVSEEDREELQSELESYFSEVELTESIEEGPDFDIVITTGTASE